MPGFDSGCVSVATGRGGSDTVRFSLTGRHRSAGVVSGLLSLERMPAGAVWVCGWYSPHCHSTLD